jgi:AcrR family transcriptional regulator
MAATTGPARGRPKDESLAERRRGQILDAATAVFARDGYPNTDVQVIADLLGLSKGTVYRYFPSKQELFFAAVDRGLRRLHESVTAAGEDVADPLDRLAVAVRTYLAFFKAHSELVELLIQERAEFRDREKSVYFEHRDARVGPWRGQLQSLIAAGRLRDVPVERIVDVVGDLLYGAMFTNHFAGRHKPHEAQAEDILDVVFHGILGDSERRRRALRSRGND